MTSQMTIDTLIILVAVPAWLLMTAALWWIWTGIEAIARRIKERRHRHGRPADNPAAR